MSGGVGGSRCAIAVTRPDRGGQRLEPSLTGRAKAGAFAYEAGKGWSLGLGGGQRLEPWLRRRAKAGAFAYGAGKGWSLGLRGGQRLEPWLTRRAKAAAFAYVLLHAAGVIIRYKCARLGKPFFYIDTGVEEDITPRVECSGSHNEFRFGRKLRQDFVVREGH
jgi:hypothetical protein